MENAVIDVLRSPELQRLRRIRQLGLANFVFPGAEHSRFAHSLGAAYNALRFGRHLAEISRREYAPGLCVEDSEVRDLALAALCHDLGHGPLSHAFEREISGKLYKRDEWITQLDLKQYKNYLSDAKWHEVVTAGLLLWPEGKLHRLLEQHEEGLAERIFYMLHGNYYIPYLPRLLSSDIDVDRADFLLRDSHQCGVTYGQINLPWLISTCTIGHNQDRLVLGFDRRKALRIVEQFIRARRALYDTVYYHKTIRCFEGMVSLFLRRLSQVVQHKEKQMQVPDFVKPVITVLRGEPLDPKQVLSLDDAAIWILIELMAKSDHDDVLRDLANRILSRELFKLVPVTQSKVEAFLRKPDGWQSLLGTVQKYCLDAPDFYVVVDRAEFEMLSKVESKQAYLVDESGVAVPLNGDPDFLQYAGKLEETVRIFTIEDAVPEVVRLLK